MSLFKQFTHVSITVTDVAKAREFYTDTLGFQEIARPAFNFPGIWYSLGGDLQLHIILNDQLLRDAAERLFFPCAGGSFRAWLAPSALAQANRSGAGSVRMKCRSGGIRNTKILPKRGEIHKAILELGDQCSAFIFSGLSHH